MMTFYIVFSVFQAYHVGISLDLSVMGSTPVAGAGAMNPVIFRPFNTIFVDMYSSISMKA